MTMGFVLLGAKNKDIEAGHHDLPYLFSRHPSVNTYNAPIDQL